MQGDLTPSPMGNHSAGAGMVPRALFKLFQQLEANDSDYSDKISYVELYNEELRDLLASDWTEPVGNQQPMSAGMNTQGSGGLKLYDDHSKRGVVIQGIEEPTVRTAADAVALLRKGSERRQTAATKSNDHSRCVDAFILFRADDQLRRQPFTSYFLVHSTLQRNF